MQLFTVKSVGVSIQVKQIYSEGIPFHSNPLLGLFFDSVLPRKKYTFPIYKWCKYEFSVKWGWNIYKILDSPEILIVFNLLDMFYDVQ